MSNMTVQRFFQQKVSPFHRTKQLQPLNR